MTRARRGWTRLVTAGLLAALAIGPTSARAQTGSGVAGQAYGASVAVIGATQGKTPLAVLDPALGLVQSSLASLTVAGVLTTGALDATSSGVVGENAATAQSRSSVAGVSILGGVVRAEHVLALASSASNGIRATSNAAGSSILGLVINGVPMGDVTPAPNTSVNVLGVGTVILNEQVPTGGGPNTSGLTVNMLHVVLKNPLTGVKTGDIIVGSAQSRASFFR